MKDEARYFDAFTSHMSTFANTYSYFANGYVMVWNGFFAFVSLCGLNKHSIWCLCTCIELCFKLYVLKYTFSYTVCLLYLLFNNQSNRYFKKFSILWKSTLLLGIWGLHYFNWIGYGIRVIFRVNFLLRLLPSLIRNNVRGIVLDKTF